MAAALIFSLEPHDNLVVSILNIIWGFILNGFVVPIVTVTTATVTIELHYLPILVYL